MNQPPPLPPPPAPLSPSLLQPKNSGLAIWSLVLGILSLFCFSILAGIPAVICGHTALSRIKHSAGALRGSGLALGGLITGYLSIALIPLIALMAAIAVPNFIKARTTAQTNFCINNLRQIDGAKQEWALENKKQETDTPTPEQLEPFLRAKFGTFVCPAGGAYSINPVGEKPACSVPGHQLPSNYP